MTLENIFNLILNKCGIGRLLLSFQSRKKAIHLKIDDASASRSLDRLEAIHSMKKINVERADHANVTNEFDVQFVIPAYNAEKYINECLNSLRLVRHSYCAVVVDDGSKDNTRKLLSRFSVDPRFKIIFQENGGSASARNTGLSTIKGKYVFFVDSDDLVIPDVIDSMLDIAIANNYDIVQGNYARTRENGKVQKTVKLANGPINTDRDLTGFPWGKLIKSSLLSNIYFPEGFLFEDTIMSMLIYPKAKTAFGVNQVCYRWRKNKFSITVRQRGSANSLDDLYLVLLLDRERRKEGISPSQDHYNTMIRQGYLHYSRLKYLGDEVLKDVFVVYSNYINRVYPSYEANDTKLRLMEKSFRTGNYKLFVAAAKYGRG